MPIGDVRNSDGRCARSGIRRATSRRRRRGVAIPRFVHEEVGLAIQAIEFCYGYGWIFVMVVMKARVWKSKDFVGFAPQVLYTRL